MTDYIDLADLKAHLNIIGNDDDELLNSKISAASEWIDTWILPLDPLLPVPNPLREAVRKLAADFYEHRESSNNEATIETQFDVFILLLPYREFEF
ncbi:head-tail connector protein [Methylocapsa aurea]|uniref:head-tail connector protein n=1 Tax=Methylocapsa aurea TaxID=663610 RepID=UPI00056275FE|nr:head-tail connector protein [Methylocapsa aurea]